MLTGMANQAAAAVHSAADGFDMTLLISAKILLKYSVAGYSII